MRGTVFHLRPANALVCWRDPRVQTTLTILVLVIDLTLYILHRHRSMFGTLTHLIRHYAQKTENLSKHNFIVYFLELQAVCIY